MSIEDGRWWDKSLNPIVCKDGGYHCTKISEGCKFCWAEGVNLRFHNKIPYDNRPVEFEIDQKVHERPLRYRKSYKIFVCDMMDIFHKKVSDEQIFRLFETMNGCPKQTFLILTKRPERDIPIVDFTDNIWLGVSVEDEKHLYRINALEKIPAAHKFVNLEPLLSDIYIADYLKYLNWVVLGCESLGNRAGRPCELEWVRNIIQQCKAANVPVFIKQIPINSKAEKDMSKWPKDLRIRQWPE